MVPGSNDVLGRAVIAHGWTDTFRIQTKVVLARRSSRLPVEKYSEKPLNTRHTLLPFIPSRLTRNPVPMRTRSENMPSDAIVQQIITLFGVVEHSLCSLQNQGVILYRGTTSSFFKHPLLTFFRFFRFVLFS
jgi:hypothetical protein